MRVCSLYRLHPPTFYHLLINALLIITGREVVSWTGYEYYLYLYNISIIIGLDHVRTFEVTDITFSTVYICT